MPPKPWRKNYIPRDIINEHPLNEMVIFYTLMLNIHTAIYLAREIIGRRGLGQFVHWLLGVNPIIDFTSDRSDIRRFFSYSRPLSEVVVMTVQQFLGYDL